MPGGRGDEALCYGMSMADYPEHDKMHAVQDQAYTIGSFLEWLLNDTPYFLAEYDDRRRLEPIRVSFETLLYRYFQVDRDKIEAEKDQMLDKIRAANDVSVNTEGLFPDKTP